MTTFTDRIIRAARLNVNVYEEVEADKGALRQTMAVVVLSSITAGVGSIEKAGFSGILIGTIIALISWYVWAYLTYFIGTKLLPEPQTKADLRGESREAAKAKVKKRIKKAARKRKE